MAADHRTGTDTERKAPPAPYDEKRCATGKDGDTAEPPGSDARAHTERGGAGPAGRRWWAIHTKLVWRRRISRCMRSAEATWQPAVATCSEAFSRCLLMGRQPARRGRLLPREELAGRRRVLRELEGLAGQTGRTSPPAESILAMGRASPGEGRAYGWSPDKPPGRRRHGNCLARIPRRVEIEKQEGNGWDRVVHLREHDQVTAVHRPRHGGVAPGG